MVMVMVMAHQSANLKTEVTGIGLMELNLRNLVIISREAMSTWKRMMIQRLKSEVSVTVAFGEDGAEVGTEAVRMVVVMGTEAADARVVNMEALIAW